MIEPTPLAPRPNFRDAVRWFPLPSINILVENARGEFLYVYRKNNPAKGLWWVPGGRLVNGETAMQAATRVIKMETGLDVPILAISPEYSEELWGVAGYDDEDWKIYDPATTCVHYWATAAYARMDKDMTVTLDSQSSDSKWFMKPPTEHAFLQKYFEMIKRTGAMQ